MHEMACPRCFARLDELNCAGCGISFSVLGEVFWLWPDPVHALLDWRNRFNYHLARVERDKARATDAQSELSTTQKRLNALMDALTAYEGELRKILAAFNLNEPLAPELHSAIRTQLPDHHGLDSYNPNIFRDWTWGDEECREVCTLLTEALQGHAESSPSLLVCGAGAGRLTYDLHASTGARVSYSLDSNPLLAAVAAAMFSGHSLELTEFPLAPVDKAAVRQTLESPAPADDLYSICGDVLSAPFAANSLDIVVTPWLIDVIDADLDELLVHIASLLKPDGIWLMHGSLSFESSDPRQRILEDELRETAESHGFEVLEQMDRELPYMQSPHSRHRRIEQTHTLLCRVNNPPSERPVVRSWMPLWLNDLSLPVPLESEFQAQMTSSRITSFIMGLIDGKRSIADMAATLEEQRLMPKLDATEAVRSFLKTMHNERIAQLRKG